MLPHAVQITNWQNSESDGHKTDAVGRGSTRQLAVVYTGGDAVGGDGGIRSYHCRASDELHRPSCSGDDDQWPTARADPAVHRGLFGALVIAPKATNEFDRLREHVVVLSDWTDEDADSVLHTLKRGSEWYSIRKGSGQSVLGAARLGMLGDYFSRELQRMPPMDLADVYYDRFLLNGAIEQTLAAQPGEKIRLRVIDGSSSTFFYMQFAGGPLQIVAADGQPVQPFNEQRLLIGVAETYDVIVTVPPEGSYEFRATAHDGSGQTSLWIGSDSPSTATWSVTSGS